MWFESIIFFYWCRIGVLLLLLPALKCLIKLLLLSLISNDKRTDWSPVQSVNISDNKIVQPHSGSRIFFINIMITGSIGLCKVLLPINHKNYIFWEKKNCQGIKKKGKFVSIDWQRNGKCSLFLWWLKPRLQLVDVNYNLECDLLS